MKKDVTVVMLAGGVGKRFWPFVTDKSLFPFGSDPIIVTNIRAFIKNGFSHFVIVTNAENDAFIRSITIPEVTIETVIQSQPHGMGDAILTAAPLIKGRSVLIVNAEDVVSDALFTELVASIRKKEPFVVGRKVSEYFDGGYLEIAQGRLVGIVEKPGVGKEPSALVNLVFHYFPYADNVLSHIERVDTKRDDRYEQALDLFAKEFPVSVLSYDGPWAPLKYPWHVLSIWEALRSHINSGRGKHVTIGNNVILEGPVSIGNNVKIFENTKIVGPTYIGDNTIIGSNNIVRESMIGANCVTGFNTDIARSYIGSDCWFHSNYIGDSVLEGNVSMGSGSVLANFRLDEGEIQSTQRTKLGAMIARDVRIGVNVSIMPGIKIGTNSMIGAGLVIDADIPEDSFCTGKLSLEIKKNTRDVTSDRATYKSKL